MKGFSKLLTATAVCASVAMTGCAPGEEPVETADEIIGGVDAFAPKLNAIGTVGFKDDDGNYGFVCTATLIAPQVVLTAKHCVLELNFGLGKLVNLIPMYFAVGPDAKAPLKVVEAVAADVSFQAEGGFVGLGNDVALLYLVEPITDITPMRVARRGLKQEHVGRKYLEIGYGSQDLWEDLTGDLAATRKLGTGTLSAVRGQLLQMMYQGDKDHYFYDLSFMYGAEIVAEYQDLLLEWWNNTPLLPEYELYVGNQPGDAQTCHGDSGGPLLRKATDGQVYAYGVVSGGWFSEDLSCDYGTVYASIGPKTVAMIEKGLTWTDSCRVEGNLVTAQGSCSGTVATRCSDKWEGDRRLLQVDCAALDLVCGTSESGRVACVDPENGRPATPEVTPGKAPTLAEIRSQVVRASRGEFNPRIQAFFNRE